MEDRLRRYGRGRIDRLSENWTRWFEEGEVVKLDSHICDSSDWVDTQPTQ